MAADPILQQTLLVEGTVQAEPLVNEMLGRIIAGLVRVNSWGDTAPPGSPSNFDAYIIGASATGDWSGQDGKVAVYLDGWKYITPSEGLRVRVADTDTEIFFDGTAWRGGFLGFQTLVDGATINWDTALGRTAYVVLGDNRTMAAPTNLVDGQTYVLHVKQDGTGSRTLTWNAAFHWPGGSAPTLTATADKIDIFTFQARGGVLYGSTLGLNYT